MQGGHAGHVVSAAQWEMKIIGMKMNQIEIRHLGENFFHHEHMVCERVFALRIKPQSPRARRHEPGIRYRISAGE
jgi:hypothetical protein